MSVGALIDTLLAQDSCLIRNAMLKRARWGSNPDLHYANVMSSRPPHMVTRCDSFLYSKLDYITFVIKIIVVRITAYK